MKKALAVLLLAAAMPAAAQKRLPVILDHDGHVDDILALALLAAERADLRAVLVSPADSFKEPAMKASQLLLDFMGARGTKVAGGDDPGPNPFPEEWRADSLALPRLKELSSIKGDPKRRLLERDAPAELVRRLSGKGRFTLIETGPLSNIAAALKLDPSIAKKVDRLWIMGGAVRVKGNVDREGHDGSAEWNFYNNPPAADAVFRSGIPITLIALDVTNKVPVTRSFLERLKAQEKHRVSRLALDAWALAGYSVEHEKYEYQYFFWDTLTAAAALRPDLVKTEKARVRVVTEGASQGRSLESPDGVEVDLGVDVDPAALEAFLLSAFAR